jgi:hypothetical protein
MFAIVLAIAMSPGVCPIRIGIGVDGVVFTNAMHGWYKTSLKSLDGALQGECYNDSNPSPVTSVSLFLAPAAPKPRVDAVLSVLKTEGWSRDKIRVESWRSYPSPPQ